ncbi:MAG: M20/M25/M40 family metallo-hydrolase [Phycisphaerae bacterium]
MNTLLAAVTVLLGVAMQEAVGPLPEPSEVSKRAAAMVDAERLMGLVRTLPTKRAAAGDADDAAGLEATERLLVGRLKGLGLTPRFHEFAWNSPARNLGRPEGQPDAKPDGKPDGKPDARPVLYRNIIVDFTGTGRPEEVLVVSAHIDAVLGSPGADDDASGVAGVMELARILQQVGPGSRTIRLVLFNLEEVGLVGSRAYVSSWLKEQREKTPVEGGVVGGHAKAERIVGMISLEMIGYFTDAPGSQKSPIQRIEGVFEPSTVGDTIAVVGVKAHQGFSRPLIALMKAHAPDLKTTDADFMPVPIPDMMRSDHGPFIIAGRPAVMITDTANFRNPHYHRATDTAQTLDVKRFTLVVQGVVGAVRRLADEP